MRANTHEGLVGNFSSFSEYPSWRFATRGFLLGILKNEEKFPTNISRMAALLQNFHLVLTFS
jgi:hypothetical protein